MTKKAFICEKKASALLKIAGGQSAHSVALYGLLKPRDPDTIYSWLDIYKAEGVSGLLVKKGLRSKTSLFF